METVKRFTSPLEIKFEEFKPMLKGENKCQVDEQPSKVCFVIVGLLVVGLVINVMRIFKHPITGLLQSTVSVALIYIMYHHCQNCNGVNGFLMTFVVAALTGGLVHFALGGL